MRTLLATIFAVLIAFVSCAGQQERKQFQKYYQELETIKTDNGMYYRRMMPDAKQLIVYLEGSGLYSVLGTEKNGALDQYTFTYFVLDAWKDTFDILVPEKPGMHKGGIFYQDKSVLSTYTLEDHAASHAAAIEHHLSHFQYDEVVIMGFSEGGVLVPAVYEYLDSKKKVSALVVLGAGVLSQYDEFIILSDSPLPMDVRYRNGLRAVKEAYEKIKNAPGSIEMWYLGWPYRRWSSFLSFSPASIYERISVPVLFLHGEKDTSSPVESSLAAKTFDIKNCTIITYPDMEHAPMTKAEQDRVFSDIFLWLEGLKADTGN